MSMQEIAKWFNEGGTFMWVLLTVFGICWAVVIERVVFLFFVCRGSAARLAEELIKRVDAGDMAGAKAIASKRKAPSYAIMRTALERYEAGMSTAEVQEGVDQAAIYEVPRMSQRLNYLSLFANIGTLLGLLGTIIGLQRMFSSLASVEAAQKAAMLAKGIAEAMNTTAFGLVVAIPAMVLYTFLFNQNQRLLKDLDGAVVAFLSYLRDKRK